MFIRILVYNAKDCNKRIWKVTGLFLFAPILDFKMAIFKMSIMPKIAIKSNRKLLVDVSLAAILDFKGCHFEHILAYIFSFELPKENARHFARAILPPPF